MQITEYQQITEVTDDNVVLVDGPNGTKKINIQDLSASVLKYLPPSEEVSPEQHRTIFRGKDLGTSFTTEQQANVANGTFKDLFLGDYWIIDGITWRIVDINYWYNAGNTSFTTNHLVIMPDAALYTAAMNATSVTTGGYANSLMRTTNLDAAKTTINSAFGSTVLSHRLLLSTAVTSGYTSGASFYDSTVDLASEIMIYGTSIYTPQSDGTTVPNNGTLDITQLSLFQACPQYIRTRGSWWLRDVAVSTSFAYVHAYGYAANAGAGVNIGVRPVFAIG